MIIGVPKEIKADEARVALVPSGVSAFVSHGHDVIVEQGAGSGSGIPDSAYRAAGASIVRKAKSIWERVELVIKVKEPLGDELTMMQPGQIVYTFFHLASNRPLAQALKKRGVAAVAYETIQFENGTLPLLTPMSDVAGRPSISPDTAWATSAAPSWAPVSPVQTLAMWPLAWARMSPYLTSNLTGFGICTT